MIIAIGESRRALFWTNTDISWEALQERLRKPHRTEETVAEYYALPKEAQDQLKDGIGGYVGGKLKEGKRRNGYVEFRSILTLDMDYARPGIWEEITVSFAGACCVHSTRKHTPDKPRLRLIIPLKRTVCPEEYEAVARKVAEQIGIELFDDTTYEPARLMYWPTASRDGEFFSAAQEGEFLNPDLVLAGYQDWRDSSSWPVSSRQARVVGHTLQKQADPLAKSGIVGTFCRVYTIQDAIAAFLPGVYKPSLTMGRYDYIPAESKAGLIIYQDRFAYSHHGSDPACGVLCNAFDLVRLHRYRELDGSVAGETPVHQRPSYRAMCELALADEGVKRQLVRERGDRVQEFQAEYREPDLDSGTQRDWSEGEALQDHQAQQVQREQRGRKEHSDWQSSLEFHKNGGVKDTLPNLVHILRQDPQLKGIAYNAFSGGIQVCSALPWKQLKPGWSDNDMSKLLIYLAETYGLYAPAKLKEALPGVASERSFHPVKDYFDGLPPWDETERLDTLLTVYLGAEDNPYTRAVMRKTLCAAVARVYGPGTKFDSILVLNGPQGIGKSTFFRILARHYYSDSLTITDMRDKTASEKLQGYLIVEVSELTGMKKVDVETVKSFISRMDDKYRPSYGTIVENHPRQCVIVGSTNSESGFLRDITGTAFLAGQGPG